MKQLKLTILLTLLMSMTGTKALAYSFKVNGIYYNITNSSTKTVSVTYQNWYSPTDFESVPDGYYYVEIDYGGDEEYDWHYNYCTSDYSGYISIPSSVTNNGVSYKVTGIDAHAFENCFNVNSIILPSSIQSIGSYAFHGCMAKTIDIPYTVTTIGYGAFKDCSQLTSLYIGGNVTSIGSHAFQNVSGKIRVYCNIPDAEDYYYSPFWGAKFSNVFIGENVTRIGDYAFYRSNITSISLPSSLESIGYYAFGECQGLTTITLPSSLTHIEGSAFSGCSYLSVIEILSAQVSSIGESAFSGCKGLSSITIKNMTPPAVNKYTFSNMGNTTLYVPHGSKTAYQTADYWKNFGNIVDYTIDDVFTAKTKEGVDMSFKVTSISPMEVQVGEGDENYFGAKAAIDKTYAGKITIPSTVTISGTNLTFTVSQVGENAFNGCNSMTSVEMPLTIRTIEKYVFYGCSVLQEVVLPNSIKTIPESLSIGYGTSQGYAPIDGVVENIHVPSSVTWIERYAINQCDNVVIEDGNSNLQLQNRNAKDGYYDGTFSHVKKLYVGRNTALNGFYKSDMVFCALNSISTQLTDVIFGPLVTEAFTGWAFGYCNHVKSLTCLGKVPFASPDFNEIPQTAVLYVPLGSQQQYASADGWSRFSDIREVTEVTITMDDTEMVYAGDFDLDFSNVDGLKAYTAGDFDEATSTITLNPIQLVSAGKGVILKGAKGTYTVPCVNIEPTTTDALCGTISGRFIRNTEGENVNYAFDKDEHVFKPVDAAYGSLISRNGAYLSLPASSVSGNGNITLQYKEVGTAVDDVFTAKTKEGVDMSFKVTSISPMEVQVGEGDENYFGAKAAIEKNYAGKITIPSTVTIPGTNLTFTVSKVGVNAFNECNLITSVEIPLTIKTIEKGLFNGCKSLKEIVLPNSIITIPANLALKYNEGTAIEYIHVPSSVTWIGLYAISKCDTVVIEDGNTNLELENRNADDGYYDGALYGVKKLYVGSNMDNHSTSYAGETFLLSGSSWNVLNNITFGPYVTKAFWGYDFRYCDHVKSVTCLGKEPFSSPDFYTIPQTATLYVPLGSKEQYASADGWSQFENISEVTEVSITMDDTEMVYAGDFDLDFSKVKGLKAYVVSDFDKATSTITLERAQLVSAGKGVILKGAKGTYTVPCTNIEPTAADALCGTISGRFIRNTEGENVNYVFDKAEHVFKPVDAAYGCLISRNRAYLSLPASAVSVALTIKEGLMGDVNGDGMVTITDVLMILDKILGNPSENFNEKAADLNHDCMITYTDAIMVMDIILNPSK